MYPFTTENGDNVYPSLKKSDYTIIIYRKQRIKKEIDRHYNETRFWRPRNTSETTFLLYDYEFKRAEPSLALRFTNAATFLRRGRE